MEHKVITHQTETELKEVTYIGINHFAPGEYLQLSVDVRSVDSREDVTRREVYTADNTTRIPVFSKTTGQPVMVDNFVLTGYGTKTIIASQDENGANITEEVTDYSQPIYENQPYQKTVGEHEYLMAILWPMVEPIITGSIQARWGNAPAAKHYE
jgi:hypothetical protein